MTPMNAPSDTAHGSPLLALPSVSDRALVRTLAFAHHSRLPAAAEVGHLATEFRGKTAERMRYFSALLASGTALPDALDLTPGVLPANARLAIRLASETGTLNEVYAALLDARGQEPVTSSYGPGSLGSEFIRTWLGFAFCWFILAFLGYFILPTFAKMFDEFGLDLPVITQSLMALNVVVGWLVLGGLIFWLAVGVVQFWLAQELNPQWFKPWRWHQRFVPAPISLLPLLAIVVGAGRPLAAGVATLARFHPVPKLRERLYSALARIEAGTPGWQALSSEQLITSKEAQALAVAGSGDVQAWLLWWLGDQRFERQLTRRGLFTQAVALFSLLLLAVVVLWVSVGVFICLYDLVIGLT